MNSTAKCLILFLAGFVMCLTNIVLHELRHYAAAPWLGCTPTMHCRITTWDITKMSKPQAVLAVGAGPVGDFLLAGVGVLWLYQLRRHRREAAPTVADWFATILTLQAFRWLRGFFGSPSDPQPGDEAFISRALGMPGWLLPYLLALLCLLPLYAMVRLHPPGVRLLPFACLLAGVFISGQLWMTLLGALLLP
jgi:hypothetical protein